MAKYLNILILLSIALLPSASADWGLCFKFWDCPKNVVEEKEEMVHANKNDRVVLTCNLEKFGDRRRTMWHVLINSSWVDFPSLTRTRTGFKIHEASTFAANGDYIIDPMSNWMATDYMCRVYDLLVVKYRVVLSADEQTSYDEDISSSDEFSEEESEDSADEDEN